MILRLMEIVQQEEYISIEDIKNGITSNYIQDYAYILHNQDIDDDGKKKKEHYHIALRLKNPTDTKYIAKVFNIKEQYINKVKGKWVDMLLYLTHQNAENKYQYNDDDVVSNFDFIKVRDEEKEKKLSNNRLNEIIDGISQGKIKRYNYTDYINVLEQIKYKKQIDIAFNYRDDFKAKELKGGNRNMQCIYIQGDSGTGKSTYAKQIADNNNMSYFVSSGSNDILDGYKGEDCIILDDLRPDFLGMSDILKMLDNNTASTVKSRYKNKMLECTYIIITTVLSIDDFFDSVFSTNKEPIVQLKRRCKTLMKFNKDIVKIFVYNKDKKDYDYAYEIENPVKKYIDDNDTDKQIDFLKNTLLKDAKVIPPEDSIPF